MKKPYRMRIEGKCMIEGCEEDASRQLNLRMRPRDTNAIYGPNIRPAVFCREHADGGADIEIYYKPTKTGIVRFTVSAGGAPVKYTHPMRDHPGQTELWN